MAAASPDFLEGLVKTLVTSQVITDPARIAAYRSDATGLAPAADAAPPLALLLPRSTQEVSAIARLCHRHQVAMVVSGGRTGLTGGAVAQANGDFVILSLERLDSIAPVDRVGGTVTVGAGAITQRVQEAAHEAGLLMAIDLAAKGSCQIGGNIATNAGGLRFIRYDGMREQVLGLEVVLADGTVLPMNRSLVKDNSGYNLKQLFIGSEGTLGIITAATLRLHPPPTAHSLALFAAEDFAAIPELLALSRSKGHRLAAFEFFDRGSLQQLRAAYPDTPLPCGRDYPYYALLELTGEDPAIFAPYLEVNGVADSVVAMDREDYARLWRYRELLSESLSITGWVRKNDVAVAIKDLAAFVTRLKTLGSAHDQQLSVLLFGHIGDGNIHINYWVAKDAMTYERFIELSDPLEQTIESWIGEFDGSMSAEHGIGLLKKSSLVATRSPAELTLMRTLKATLDPIGLLNPGKVL